jgi:hypothetical protein
MTQTPKPDISEHEEETVPFDEVMKRLVEAKSTPEKPEPPKRKENEK